MMGGWLRLYIVICAVWAGWFGYAAYDANKQHKKATSFLQMDAFDRKEKGSSPWNREELGEWAGEQLARRDFAFKALPVTPLGLPIVYWVAWWIVAGFRKRRPF
jgi:hypothetical protein